MPIWSDILREIRESHRDDGTPDFDVVRRKYLLELNCYTNRSTILYSSGWIHKSTQDYHASINDDDIHALMEVTYGLGGTNLDLILHSPGGSPEAAEAIVSYLRSRFREIRVIVPNLAMSAATLISCAADQIVMGEHSFLGPIDPQIQIPTSQGTVMVPAKAILNEFERAKDDCSNPDYQLVWNGILSQYIPGLLESCEMAIQLSELLAETWLKSYMFKCSNCGEKASEIAKWLSEHENFKSHSRHISRNDLIDKGLKIELLENDQELQDLSLSIFHATAHTFVNTSVNKIVENHFGRAYIR